MKFHGVNVVGKLHVQRVSTLPTWTADDEGRFLFAEDLQGLFYGSGNSTLKWQGSPVIFDSVTDITKEHYGKVYRLVVWEGNIQLQEIVVT